MVKQQLNVILTYLSIGKNRLDESQKDTKDNIGSGIPGCLLRLWGQSCAWGKNSKAESSAFASIFT
jgi:hypothetical protein